MSRVRVQCRREALLHNWELLRASGKALMPVIKADAYGHGLTFAARELARAGAEHFAVGDVSEAVALRRSGFDGMIVALLGLMNADDLAAARQYRITPLIHHWQSLDLLANISLGAGELPLSVALKCDTGMARLGFLPEEMSEVTGRLRALPHVRPELLLSHLAVADEVHAPDALGEDFTLEQVRRFQHAARLARAAFPSLRLSLGNSACLLAFPELAGDLARPGVALYGGNPLFGTSRAILGAALEPVMEVSAPILSVHSLRAGESLGYGRAYIAPSERRVAWVGIGYADAYRRNPAPEMSTAMSMTVRGHRVPVIGRVAMQMTCVDITDMPLVAMDGAKAHNAGHDAEHDGGKCVSHGKSGRVGADIQPGEYAFILGGEGQGITPHELAAWWGTIPYEVMCLLGRNL